VPNLALKPEVTFCVQGVNSPILANVYLHYVFYRAASPSGGGLGREGRIETESDLTS
jgi:hypothetical protein